MKIDLGVGDHSTHALEVTAFDVAEASDPRPLENSCVKSRLQRIMTYEQCIENGGAFPSGIRSAHLASGCG